MKNMRMLSAEIDNSDIYFSPSFSKQIITAICKDKCGAGLSDNNSCYRIIRMNTRDVAIKTLAYLFSNAYGWPTVKMSDDSSVTLDYVIKGPQNFNITIYGQLKEEHIVFDSVGGACILLQSKPNFVDELLAVQLK
jgi:hypothetical protein